MFLKKVSLFLGLALFCSASCSNAEQNVLDNKLDLTQDKYVQEKEKKQDSNADVKGVCFCKIHHCDSVELEDLNLIDILCEVWKNYGFNRDEILSDDDKEKDCGCTLTRESCGCRVINMCIEHCTQLDDLITLKLQLIRENDKKQSTCNDSEAVKLSSNELEAADVESKELELTHDCSAECDSDIDSDKLKCDGFVNKDLAHKVDKAYFDWCNIGKESNATVNIYWVGNVLFMDLSDIDLSNLEPDELQVRF